MSTRFDHLGRVDEILSWRASREPDSPSVIDRFRTWTLQDLDKAASSLARVFRDLGAEEGSRIGVLSINTGEAIAIYFGSSRAGLIEVACNTRLVPTEIAYQLNNVRCETIVLSPEYSRLLSDLFAGEHWVKRVIVIPTAGQAVSAADFPLPAGVHLEIIEDLASLDLEAPNTKAGRDDPYIIWFTAGTTGRPKGAVHVHGSGLKASGSWCDAWQIIMDDVGIVANMYHVALQATMTGVLAGGASVVMLDEVFSMDRLLELIQEHRVTFFPGYSAMFGLIDKNPAMLDPYDLSSLRAVGYGASPIDPALIRRLMKILPGLRWFNMYGQSELNTGGTVLSPQDHPHRLGSIGLPLNCVDEVAILDENNQPVAEGTRGELCFRGPCPAVEYWENPEATAEMQAGGWHHTGDIAYMDRGYIYLVDRMKDIIIRGGENVYPAEIEAALHSHPAVAESAVVGHPDSVMGEVPVAYIVVRPGTTVTVDDLGIHCRKNLAKFKCPVHIEIIEDFPRNAVGKILKFELRKQAHATLGDR